MSSTPIDNKEISEITNGPRTVVGRWYMAVCLGLTIGWAGYQFAPMEWDIPEHLQAVTSFSPPEQQAELEVAKSAKRFRNYVTKMAFLGLVFGASALVGGQCVAKRIGLSLGGGAAMGVVSGIAGFYVFEYLEKAQSLPGIDEGLRPLVSDVASFTVLTIPLMIAFSLAYWVINNAKWDPASFIVYGVLVGILFPFILSVAFPDLRLDSAPPAGAVAIPIWLASIGLALFAHPWFDKRKHANNKVAGAS